MRLLRRRQWRIFSRGPEFVLELFGKDLPPYAILSHRWSDEEATYDDIVKVKGKEKHGYSKLHFCADQAAKDGLRYFWVDTVCIDKSSSAELTESINSMFRWYESSKRCYVYMHDVFPWDLHFDHSSWFTRGWTLQEFIAPRSVAFFDVDGTRIGSKRGSLRGRLHRITGIPIEAFRGERALSSFSVEERKSWIQGRETERDEDLAYCLMGIFDVSMPVIYGEQRKKAFARLDEAIDQNLKSRRDPQLLLTPPPSPRQDPLFNRHAPLQQHGTVAELQDDIGHRPSRRAMPAFPPLSWTDRIREPDLVPRPLSLSVVRTDAIYRAPLEPTNLAPDNPEEVLSLEVPGTPTPSPRQDPLSNRHAPLQQHGTVAQLQDDIEHRLSQRAMPTFLLLSLTDGFREPDLVPRPLSLSVVRTDIISRALLKPTNLAPDSPEEVLSREVPGTPTPCLKIPTNSVVGEIHGPPDMSISTCETAKECDPTLEPISSAEIGQEENDAEPRLLNRAASSGQSLEAQVQQLVFSDDQQGANILDHGRQRKPLAPVSEFRFSLRDILPVSPREKIRNENYNCFGAMSYQLPQTGRTLTASCSRCHFSMQMPEASEQLMVFNGCTVRDHIFWTNFHFQPRAGEDDQDDQEEVLVRHPFMPGFRCFICKDSQVLDIGEMQRHLQKCHTYAEVCEHGDFYAES